MNDVVDRMAFIELASGMWFHTREIAGEATVREAEITLARFPAKPRAAAILTFLAHGQLVHDEQ